MLENGIPRDQIIHLAYDDVAENRSNPFKGQLFNKPTASGVAGVNVYDQSEIDYSGAEVNKSNFLKVLLGDDTATGPVLKSDENSKVFVYFVDHGGAGLICTPNGSSDWIYADELDSTLQTMSDTKMFGELVFDLEACESGSMFPNLTDKENIYAITASNATQSSWGAYCGSEAYVDGTNIGSCLGDLFSINWMEDTEANDVSVETLATQTATVKELTTKSPVMVFGDLTFTSEAIGDFQGTTEAVQASSFLEDTIRASFGQIKNEFKKATHEKTDHREVVSSRDHDLHFYTQSVMNRGTEEDYANLKQELEHRQFVDSLFAEHFSHNDVIQDIKDYDCLRMFVGGIEDMCGPWSAYSLKYVRKVATACDTQTAEQIATTYANIAEHCGAF